MELLISDSRNGTVPVRYLRDWPRHRNSSVTEELTLRWDQPLHSVTFGTATGRGARRLISLVEGRCQLTVLLDGSPIQVPAERSVEQSAPPRAGDGAGDREQ